MADHGVGVLYVCTGCLWLIMALVYCTCVQVVYACYGPNHGVGVLYVCTGCLCLLWTSSWRWCIVRVYRLSMPVMDLIMALVYCTCVQVVSAC